MQDQSTELMMCGTHLQCIAHVAAKAKGVDRPLILAPCTLLGPAPWTTLADADTLLIIAQQAEGIHVTLDLSPNSFTPHMSLTLTTTADDSTVSHQTLALHWDSSGASDLESSRWHVMLRRLGLHWLGSYEACRDWGRGWGEGRNGWGWGVMAAGT